MIDRGEHRNTGPDLRAEVRPTSRATVLLVRGKHIGAAGLKTLLIDLPGVALIAEERLGTDALSAAQKHQPSLILVGTDGVHDEAIRLLRQLRAASGESRIIVFSDDDSPNTLVQLGRIPVDSCLPWAVVTRETLSALFVLLDANAWVTVRSGMQRVFLDQEASAPQALELTADERLVVDALEAGHTPNEMLDEVPMSARARQRVMKRLLERLGARNAYQLGKLLAERRSSR